MEKFDLGKQLEKDEKALGKTSEVVKLIATQNQIIKKVQAIAKMNPLTRDIERNRLRYIDQR